MRNRKIPSLLGFKIVQGVGVSGSKDVFPVIGILNIVLGLIILKYNFATQVVLMRFIGIALLVAAITSVSNGFMVTDANKRKNEAQSVDFTTEPYKDDK